MRCRAWVIERPGRQKGNGERSVKLEAVTDAYAREQPVYLYDERFPNARIITGMGPPARVVLYPEPPEKHPEATLCGGRIVASVRAADEPYYGGMSAVLEIGYICERCKWAYHGPDLPDSGDKLSALLTEYIANLPNRSD